MPPPLPLAEVEELGPGAIARLEAVPEVPVFGVTRPGVMDEGDPAPFKEDIELEGVRPVGGFLREALRSLLPSSIKINAVR